MDNTGFVDRLERPVLVKPEGIPVEKVQSEMVCLKEGEQKNVEFEKLVLPDQVSWRHPVYCSSSTNTPPPHPYF